MEEYRLIPITGKHACGRDAKVSPEDYEYLSKFNWHANNFGYAVRNNHQRAGLHKTKMVLMHREVLDAAPGVQVDHINSDPLDNRRTNLRLATNQQNSANRNISSTQNTSGFKGVSWYRAYEQWRAYITINGKFRHLGYFDRIEDAAKAYDEAARESFGEFALTNFD